MRIPRKLALVKRLAPPRYSRRVDALGRSYVIDKQSGRRARSADYQREQKRRAKQRAEQEPARKPRKPAPAKPRKPAPAKPRKPAPAKPRKPAPAKPRKPAPAKPRKPAPAPAKPRKPVPAKPRKPRKPAKPREYSQEYIDKTLTEARAAWEKSLENKENQFVHPFQIPGFAEDIRERAEKYPKVKDALDIAASLDVPLDRVSSAVREAFFDAFYSQDTDMNAFIYDMAEMLDREIDEVYELVMSPGAE